MDELTYVRPASVSEAVAQLSMDGARPIAGGSDLIPQMREGRRRVSRVVDLKHTGAFTAIEPKADGGWRVGAAATIGAMRKHARFAAAHGTLLDSAGLIGSLQVQNRASLGGNLCNAAPSADGVPLLIALDVIAEIHGPHGERRVPAGAIPIGPGRTSLGAGEVLVALHFPPRAARSADRYLRFTPRREMDIAVAGSGVRIDLGDDGRITTAAIVLASVGPTPIRAEKAGKTLLGHVPSTALFGEAGAIASGEAQPISDTRGTADYRRDLVAVLTRRALADCAARLGVSIA